MLTSSRNRGRGHAPIPHEVGKDLQIVDLDVPASTDTGIQNPPTIVEQEIEDSEFDLYTCLSETPSGYDDLDLTLERKPIAELLCASPIDGHAAFRAWGLGQATTR